MGPDKKGVQQMRIEKLNVTPEMAATWLTTSKGNRSIRETQISQYARKMAGGVWIPNGESIQFDSDGHLIDGHHRLRAVIRAGVPVEFLVVYGVSPLAPIDEGRARTASDKFNYAGIKPSALASSVSKALIAFKATGKVGIHGNQLSLAAGLPSHQDLIDFYVVDDRAQRAVALAVTKTTAIKLLSPTVVATLWYSFSLLDEDEATKFFSDLNDGEGLDGKDPVFLLRSRLTNSMLVRRSAKFDLEVRSGWTIKTWNARRKQSPMRITRLMNNEAFPVAI